MKASVVIPTKNGGERFGRALEALFANTLDGGFEVLVIDSGSTDETLAASRRFPARLVEIRPQEFGHGRVRNLGGRLTSGAVLVFLSQDAIPASRDWLARLLRPLDEDAEVAGVYSRQLPDDTHPMESFFLRSTYGEERIVRWLPENRRRAPLSLHEVLFSNVASAIRREAWERWPFREDLAMSEDVEWSTRVLRAGSKVVYEPAACVYHSHAYDLGSAWRRNYQSGASLVGVVREPFIGGARRALGFLAREADAVRREHGPAILPRMLLYEAVRHAAFAAGSLRGRFGRHTPATESGRSECV